MNQVVKEETYATFLKGQKVNYQGYPNWYKDELAKNQPITIERFNNDLESAVNFYSKEVNKLFFANTVLSTQLRAAIQEKNSLFELISTLEEAEEKSCDQKRKRVRRCASDIVRRFVCQIVNCDKSYGTEGSMAQHMRLKHPDVEYNGVCSQMKINKDQAKVKEEEVEVKVKRQ